MERQMHAEMSPSFSQKTPAWQIRRAEILQNACIRIAERVKSGTKICRAIKIAAKELAGADLGNGRRLALSEKTMYRNWYRWRGPRDASVFRLKYFGNQRPSVDPVLLRLVVEHCLKSGASLENALEAIRPAGAKVSIQAIYHAVPKRARDSLWRSHKELLKRRMQLEGKLLSSHARLSKRFLKQRAELHRKLLDEDARLQTRLLRERERLQRKFLQSDARAVRQREKLQRKFLNRELHEV
jgi:hypothetical protein